MKLTLNVGCGERIPKDYPKGHKCINIDIRKNLKDINVVSDVQNLPFKNDSFDYIFASDIIEHFPIAKTDNILKEWCRVLKKGGIIEFRAPNLAYICRAYVAGIHDAKMTSWLLYGGQGYEYNFHYVGFDRKWLNSILSKHGLVEFSYQDVGNNFELKARYNG
jgi:ubiquinone/menaquinone biosynthesis C-methylase UbiE